MKNVLKILFICHGNICRSPMAEFVFKDIVKREGLEDRFHIESAATHTDQIWDGVGDPVYPPARKELARHGIGCEGKRARLLNKNDYEKFDYLIGMDEANIKNILRITGRKSSNKVSLLLKYAGENRNISDPWYTGDFEATWDDVKKGCEALFEYFRSEGKI
ncbi:MAG: low molecular weight protein-tyrosine-phosphatase [Bacillota bacterium]|nr:low molecular weight protein-tyrosine-phosphatase [Bacillota bacterium]